MNLGKTLLTTALCAGAVLAAVAPAEAQVRIWVPWHRHSDFRYVPMSESVHVFRIPKGGYHYGGVNVYRLPGRRWEFGYPQSYTWPYGYPRSYRWPYGSPWRY